MTYRSWLDPVYGGYYEPQEMQSGHASTIETTEQETFTGLYDAEGNPLHRERRKIGFL